MSVSIGEPQEQPQVSELSESPELTTSETAEAPSEASDNSGNPAWASVLEAVPAAFHNMVKPKLEEWDKGVQDRFAKIHEQYAPLKPFLDQQVNPERLSQGLRLANTIDQDPVAFYNHMGERLRAAGFLKEAAAAEAKADEIEDKQEAELEFKDPRLDTFMQQLQEAQQKAEYEKQEAAAAKELDAEISQVEALHGGPLGDALQREILLRAQAMYDIAASAKRPLPSLVDAYKSQMAFMAEYQKQAPRAPQVIPGGGGLPTPVPPDAKQYATDDNARRQAAMSVIKRMHG